MAGLATAHPRVFVGNGHHLLALDVTTGKPAPGFGDEGRVDLKKGVLGDLKDGRYALESPPAVFSDIVITGCSNGEGSPSQAPTATFAAGTPAPANSSGLSIPSLAPANPAPKPGPPEPGKIAPARTPGASSRSIPSAASSTLPLGSPTSDFYGADRIGDGLYGNSLVALDARTGQRSGTASSSITTSGTTISPRPPALFDIRRGGRSSPPSHRSPKWACCSSSTASPASRSTAWKSAPFPQTAIPGEVTSQDPALSAEAAAPRARTPSAWRTLRPLPGPRPLLQGAVRNQPA